MASRHLRWTVGDVRITRILEVEVSGMSFLIPDAVPANVARIGWLRPPLVTPGAEVVCCIQSFAIEAPGRRILVDTSVGPDRIAEIPTRIERSTRFLEAPEAADLRPEAFDTVVFTHLHFDHLGWASRAAQGRRVPTFPGARYLIARAEWEYWSGLKGAATEQLLADSLKAPFDAGQVDLVAPNREIAAGIQLLPTPGHTPGHVSVEISSRGAQAVITGDVIHHPAQMARTAWWTTFDANPDLARRTRIALLERLADTGALVVGTHFPEPTAGRIAREGEVFRFLPWPG